MHTKTDNSFNCKACKIRFKCENVNSKIIFCCKAGIKIRENRLSTIPDFPIYLRKCECFNKYLNE